MNDRDLLMHGMHGGKNKISHCACFINLMVILHVFLCRVTTYQHMYILVNEAQSLLEDEKFRYMNNMVYILY